MQLLLLLLRLIRILHFLELNIYLTQIIQELKLRTHPKTITLESSYLLKNVNLPIAVDGASTHSVFLVFSSEKIKIENNLPFLLMKWKMSRLKMSKCQEFHMDETELSRYFLPISCLNTAEKTNVDKIFTRNPGPLLSA